MLSESASQEFFTNGEKSPNVFFSVLAVLALPWNQRSRGANCTSSLWLKQPLDVVCGCVGWSGPRNGSSRKNAHGAADPAISTAMLQYARPYGWWLVAAVMAISQACQERQPHVYLTLTSDCIWRRQPGGKLCGMWRS